MNVLIDTNVIIDYLQNREEFISSAQVVMMCAKKEINGFMAAHSIPNIFFILRKEFSEEERRELLLSIIKIIPIVNINHDKIVSALMRKEFIDFEDCLQDECAEEIGAAYIVTRNIKDFTKSKIPAVIPSDFVDLMSYL